MAGRILLVAWILMLLALAPGVAIADEAPIVRPMKGLADEGTFTYLREGEHAGSSTFLWNEDGSFESSSVIGNEEWSASTTTRIEVDEAGVWTVATVESHQGLLVMERKGANAELRYGAEEKKTFPLTPGTVIFEDMSPALMRLAVQVYDAEAGGKQRVPVLFVPLATVQASLERIEKLQQDVAGETLTFRKYRYVLPPFYPVVFTVNEADQVCTAVYPLQNTIFVRSGYEALLPVAGEAKRRPGGPAPVKVKPVPGED